MSRRYLQIVWQSLLARVADRDPTGTEAKP